MTGRAARAGIFCIRIYQAAWSSRRPSSCRYLPSCSAYALEAISAYGLVRGTWLGTKRIARCHPWHAGGWDPLPTKLGTEPESDSSDLKNLLGRAC